jgi:hypothetical protein
VYLGEWDALTILDVRNPAQPVRQSRLQLEGAASIQVVGRYAYITYSPSSDHGGLQIIDLNDPTNPVLRSTIKLSGGAVGVDVVGDYAYVTGQNVDMQIIDTSDIAHPIARGTADMPRTGRNLTYANPMVYVIGYGELYTFDVNLPDQPIERSIYHIMGATDIQVADKVAYVATYNRGLHILDVNDPVNPVLLGVYIGSAVP